PSAELDRHPAVPAADACGQWNNFSSAVASLAVLESENLALSRSFLPVCALHATYQVNRSRIPSEASRKNLPCVPTNPISRYLEWFQGLCPDLGDDKLTPELVKPADGWPPKPVVPSAKELGRDPVHVRWSIQPNARLIRKLDG